MTHELESLKKYLEGEIVRVRAAEHNNFDNSYSNEDDHLYATAYNVVSNLLSFNKNIILKIDSKFNHQLIKSTIENIFLLRMFNENKITGKYVDLYKQHFRVVNFQHLKAKYEIDGALRALGELKEAYNKAINCFITYYPKLSREEAVKIFSKRFGWLYSYSYRDSETKLINLLLEFGTEYEMELYRRSSIYAHSNFFVSEISYADNLINYCFGIIVKSIDIGNFVTKTLKYDYSKIVVPRNEVGDLISDKLLNYTHAYKLKFKQLIEMAATKSYLQMNPDRLQIYILISYIKTIKNDHKLNYRDIVDKTYREFKKNSEISLSYEEFSGKVINKLFGFTFKNKGNIEDYNTFIKKQFNKLCKKGILTKTYESIIEEVNLLDHPSMYAYLNIEQGNISEYLQLEKELKDYLF